MSDTPIYRARALLLLRETLPVLFADSMNMCDQMADVLQEMVDKVERLQWQCDNLMTDVNVLGSRAEAAEARLRELASAEPVALLSTGVLFGGEQDEWEIEANSQHFLDEFCAENPGKTIALIRRPEMPS